MILMSGPCVIEDRDTIFNIAHKLSTFQEDQRIDFYFKSSFDKANRTSLGSFRGPGLDEGLKILQDVKKEFGFKLVTDVHETYQVQPAAEVVDVVQIPAFLCRQTDLLVAAAKTNATINIKKGQFLSAPAMKYPVQKVLHTRDELADVSYESSLHNRIWLCERGNTFGYGSLVVDMRNLILMKSYAPVIFDATHSVQIPSDSSTTKGCSDFVAPMARAAATLNIDGFFFETHTDPQKALSDGPNMIPINELYTTVEEILSLRELLGHL